MATKCVLRRLGYRVVDHIGEGAYSKVKLATSTKHPNKVAIKILDRRRITDNIMNAFLTRELTILRSIRHPHIVQVHEIAETRRGKIFIVMECAKMNLTEKIMQVGRIPIGQAKKWFSQLVDAMVYLHQQGIVHRDIKCKNVLLTPDNKVKLTDFGLARSSKGELSDTYCGTPYFMAPEILNGMSYNPMKSDVWSMGALLYRMVTGIMPFRPSTMFELRKLHQEPLVFPCFIRVCSHSCLDLIFKMLQVNPSDRPTMMEVSQHPWLLSLRKMLDAPVPATPSQGEFLIPLQQIDEDSEDSSSDDEWESEVDDKEDEDMEEKVGCFVTLQQNLKKAFRCTSSPCPPAEPLTAFAACLQSEQKQVDQTPDIPDAATPERKKRRRFRWLRFPLLKILKNMRDNTPLTPMAAPFLPF